MFDKLMEELGRAALQPVADTYELIDGLSEGELRERAALRLGGTVVAGMTAAELIDWWQGASE